MDRVSPVSRFMRSVADRAPSWVAIAGNAVSLYCLMALSSSDFLYLDLTTPAFISHLRENHEPAQVDRRVALRWAPDHNPILLPVLEAESRGRTLPGNTWLPTLE